MHNPHDEEPATIDQERSVETDTQEIDALIGTTLRNTYAILRVIGEGGMGRVYEAQHTRIAHKRFAIKTLHPEFCDQEEVVARFLREAEAMATLSHAHVVGVYDVDRTPDGRPFLVTEFLEGQSLRERLDEAGKLTVQQIVPIARQVCGALGAAHKAGIVHRDVKPANIFLAGGPDELNAKVLDFGISRLNDAADGRVLTQVGTVMGTPSYMSPQQARGDELDHRTDIYGVGAILYTALTGKAPFERADPTATVLAVLTGQPDPPRTLAPSIPEGLEVVIQKAMAIEADDRYQRMSELSDALSAYETRDTSPTTLRLPVAQKDQAARDARPLLVLFVATSMVLLLVGFVTAASGVMRWAGAELTTLETAIVLFGGAAGLFTPAVLLFRYLKQHAWQNSFKTLATVRALQRPVVAATCTYGLLALWIRLLANVVNQGAFGIAWPVWDLLLFLTSAVAVGVAVLTTTGARTRSNGTPSPSQIKRSQIKRLSVRPILLLVLLGTLVVSVGLLPMIFMGNDAQQSAVSAAGSSTAKPQTSIDYRARHSATTKELNEAKSKGMAALSALAKKYERDATVRKTLMLAQAKAPGGMLSALASARVFIAMAKAARHDKDLRALLIRAASASDPERSTAYKVIVDNLRWVGSDILYEITVKQKAQRKYANRLLAPRRTAKFSSPALLVVLGLRDAKGCKSKTAWLSRIEQVGDERSVVLLKRLIVTKKRGCGFMRLEACKARCKRQSRKIRHTIQIVRSRAKK